MISLVQYLRECECGCGCIAATPMNTVGMGNVEPLSSDPVPTNTPNPNWWYDNKYEVTCSDENKFNSKEV